jgi:hypothetical protein
MAPVGAMAEGMCDSQHMFDEFSAPILSCSEDLADSQPSQSDGPPSSMVSVNPLQNNLVVAPPNVDSMHKTFGISYTTAHDIETKLAKMLNDIQAPKTIYASI